MIELPRPIQDFVYQRLQAIARLQLHRGQRFAQTTSLVHEAYLRLHGAQAELTVEHFYAVAATAMRQILVDRARAAHALKRGGAQADLALDQIDDVQIEEELPGLLWVDQALARVHAVDPRLATLVELKVFAGLEVPEIARALSVSERSVKRYWRQARALMLADLGTDELEGLQHSPQTLLA